MPRISRHPVRASIAAGMLAASFGLVSAQLLANAPQGGNNKTIYVAAIDPLKKPVAGLTKDTWAVQEDGQNQPIVDVKPATDPIDVYLLIDTSVNLTPSVSDVREALEAFAQALFAGSAPVTMSVMDVAQGDPTVVNSKKTLADVTKELSKTYADRTGSVVMLEAINDAAKKLAKSPNARRAIVLVNIDGVSETSSEDPNQVIQSLIASNASLWAVTYQNAASMNINNGGSSGAGVAGNGVTGSVGNGNVGQVLSSLLSQAPEGTGGLRDEITTSTALKASLTDIANVILGQYAVTYTRSDSNTAKTVQLGNAKPGVTVLYASTPIK